MKSHHALAAAAFVATLSLTAQGHEFKAKDMLIVHPFAVPTMPGAMSGAAYLTLENKGTAADKLLAISTPRAKRVELHTMRMDGGIMRMREVDAIEVKAGETIKMRPSAGYHLMLMELPQPLKDGETFPMTLTFEKSGKIEVKAYVQAPKTSAMEHKH